MVEQNQLDYTAINGDTYFVMGESTYYETAHTWQVFVRMDLTFTLSETKTPAFPITMGSAEVFFCYALSL